MPAFFLLRTNHTLQMKPSACTDLSMSKLRNTYAYSLIPRKKGRVKSKMSKEDLCQTIAGMDEKYQSLIKPNKDYTSCINKASYKPPSKAQFCFLCGQGHQVGKPKQLSWESPAPKPVKPPAGKPKQLFWESLAPKPVKPPAGKPKQLFWESLAPKPAKKPVIAKKPAKKPVKKPAKKPVKKPKQGWADRISARKSGDVEAVEWV
jgi:hypothetical protein